MKFLIVASALLALASCIPVDEHFVSVTEDTLGNYRFAFDAGDHSKQEERKSDGFTKGHFTFVDTDGDTHKIAYRSGAEIGFVAEGTHLPVAPAPVPETPEVLRAREEHLAAWNAAAATNGVFEEDSTIVESPTSARKTIKVLVPVIEYHRL